MNDSSLSLNDSDIDLLLGKVDLNSRGERGLFSKTLTAEDCSVIDNETVSVEQFSLCNLTEDGILGEDTENDVDFKEGPKKGYGKSDCCDMGISADEGWDDFTDNILEIPTLTLTCFSDLLQTDLLNLSMNSSTASSAGIPISQQSLFPSPYFGPSLDRTSSSASSPKSSSSVKLLKESPSTETVSSSITEQSSAVNIEFNYVIVAKSGDATITLDKSALLLWDQSLSQSEHHTSRATTLKREES